MQVNKIRSGSRYKEIDKNMRVIVIFLLGTYCFLPGRVKAQDPNTLPQTIQAQFQEKQVIAPSPEAAELGKYGNVPVSLFTGTPAISIPVFELQGKRLSLPVTLTYNASGFKPEEIAP